MLTANDLAEKAGITPGALRRLLRKKFNQAGKTEVGDKREEYRFDPNDPVVKQIMALVKGKPADKPKATKTKVSTKAQKPKSTESKVTDELAQKGGESDDNAHPNS